MEAAHWKPNAPPACEPYRYVDRIPLLSGREKGKGTRGVSTAWGVVVKVNARLTCEYILNIFY